MLSDNDIRRAIDRDEIIIDPFTEDHLRPSGVVFHLGESLLQSPEHEIVDVRSGKPPAYDLISIAPNSPFTLPPRGFVLGQTLERVSLSTRYSLMIEGRSTLARLGLTIVQTATLVYPGHTSRSITLELANHGPHSILLYPGMKIARGMFFELSSPASYHYDSEGKYQSQIEVGEPIFSNEVNSELLKTIK